MRMNVNKIIRYSMQLAILKQLKLKNMITEEEYEKILCAIRKDYQVISDISPWQNKCATVYMHVKTVVLLSQQKPDDVIEVEIELDELEDAGILARLVWSDLWIDLRMRHREYRYPAKVGCNTYERAFKKRISI